MSIQELLKNHNHFTEVVLEKMDPLYMKKDSVYIEKSKKDIWYTLLFLAQSISLQEENIIKEYLKWTDELFDHLGFQDDTVFRLFDIMKEELSLLLDSDEMNFISKIGLEKSESTPDKDNPYEKEMNIYTDYLLNHNRKGSTEYVQSLVDSGVSVKDIYVNIFQQAMYKIGDLWHSRKIGVADEHYATVVTQLNITSLYPYIFDTEKIGKKMLATSIGSELHEMGVRMVADLFELHGWNTVYLGANIPVEEVMQFVEKFEPDLIALSVTMSLHLTALKDAITKIKDKFPHIKIMVGGLPFINNPELYKKMNADGTAKNGLEAVKVGESLV